MGPSSVSQRCLPKISHIILQVLARLQGLSQVFTAGLHQNLSKLGCCKFTPQVRFCLSYQPPMWWRSPLQQHPRTFQHSSHAHGLHLHLQVGWLSGSSPFHWPPVVQCHWCCHLHHPEQKTKRNVMIPGPHIHLLCQQKLFDENIVPSPVYVNAWIHVCSLELKCPRSHYPLNYMNKKYEKMQMRYTHISNLITCEIWRKRLRIRPSIFRRSVSSASISSSRLTCSKLCLVPRLFYNIYHIISLGV